MNFLRKIFGLTKKIEEIISCILIIKEHIRITYSKDTFIKSKIEELENLIKGI